MEGKEIMKLILLVFIYFFLKRRIEYNKIEYFIKVYFMWEVVYIVVM